MKQPHIQVGEGEINRAVLLPGDPGRVDTINEHLDNAEVIAENREYRVSNGVYQDTPVSVCSTGVGSPAAAVAVEELANVGADTLVRVGTCGALQTDINVGDNVVATAAAKYEGTTKRYEDVELPAAPSPDVTNALAEAARGDGEVHVGPIVTDDAFYAEEEPALEWEEARMFAVEMEAAIIFTLARRRGLRSGAILSVDGNLVLGTQKGETSGEELPGEAEEGVEREIEIALEAVSNLTY